MPSNSLQRTLQEVAIARQVFGKRRRRALPRVGSTKPIERAYARELLHYIDRARLELSPLMQALPRLFEGVEASRPTYDAGEGKRASELVREAAERMGLLMHPSQLEALAAQFAARTASFQKRQLQKQLNAALGVDVFINDRALQVAAEAFVQENVVLIKDLVPKVYGEIEREVARAITGGVRHEDLARVIRERFAMAENRAKLIARDQVGKYYGKVNEVRQRTLGITHFIWRTVNDSRVRRDHSDREGVQYSWENAPEGGPGQPVNCRCNAEPVLDDLINDG